ncbi:MAG: TolC family protein [Muribaculaceae bacterium]|nr:TolC family protein [Muribaculaceae bacterium]
MKIDRIIAGVILSLTLIVGACHPTKNCLPPDLDLPGSINGNSVDTVTFADMQWWKFYTDSALTHIIEETLEHNRDFLTAAARVEQLRALYGVEKLNMTPTVTAQVYGNNETNDYYGEPHMNDPEYGAKASLNWEIDLWGGLRKRRSKAGNLYRASVEDMRAMKITLIAEVATAYFRLLALDNELAIVRRTLFTREESAKKAKLRFEGGLTSETVYQQAQVEYATTAALIPGLERNIEVQRNAIELLMGRFPGGEVERGQMLFERDSIADVPMGVPSQLMQRRPDIAAAEARLKAALDNVGVVYADRFPRLSIGLTGGVENDEIKGLFNSPFTFVVGQVSGTLLDFGRRKRQHRAAVAEYDQARLAYEKCVLTAFHEVDDAAITFSHVREAAARRHELLKAAQKYTQLAYAQYNAGAINYIDVLDASRRYFDAQIGMNNAVLSEYLALVNLYKVLGGGWR